MSTLFPGQSLQPGQTLQSDNQLHTLIMQSDGNVVLYNSASRPLWWTNTGGGLIDPRDFIMQNDGNLVLYDTSGQPHWDSNTWGNPGAFLDVQDDGNLVVYRAGSATETANNALWEAGSNDAPSDQNQAILAAHNSYRAQVGVPPLQWSDSLAASAQNWANYLATIGTLQEPGVGGVNLADATAGTLSVTQLVGLWGNEQQYFIDGVFPDISTTGNWEDAGHYSQMVWRNTTEVGGGLATGQGLDFLVCYYNPAGNVSGETAY
jgi:hypothetical protein